MLPIKSRHNTKELPAKKHGLQLREEALDAIFSPPEDPKPLSDRKIKLASGGMQWGKMLFPDGKLYKGCFKNNEPNGQGKIIYPDGSKYVGSVVNGKREGFGIKYGLDGKRKYEGDWFHGKREGKGTSFYRNGSQRYEGNWARGKENGYGTKFWPEGTKKSDGNWVNGHLQGKDIKV